MERSEPSFVPEWYKGTSSTATGNSNSNHISGPLHSDEYNGGLPLRNKLSVSVCDQDAPRSTSVLSGTSLSFQRSASSNGSIRWENSSSRVYNNFGWNHRDRDRDREKDLGFHGRERQHSQDNGFPNHSDSLINSTSEKAFLRKSHSLLSGRMGESWFKRPGHDSSNDVLSGGSLVSGIIKSTFEKDFPSLGAEEKHLGSDPARVSSPVLSSVIYNLPLSGSAIIGGDGWTSALAEVPPIGAGNDQASSFVLQNSHPPTNSSIISGLNMAETLAQAPSRVHAVPKLPNDSQKFEKLHRQQILKLRPVTPSMLNNPGANTADKSKTKGAKIAEFSPIKSQPSSHFVNPNSVRAEASKTPLPGQFQILNRGNNGVSPSPTNDTRAPITFGTINPKLKADANGGDKKTHSQVQKRNDFFNSLRKKASASNDPSCDTSSSNLQKADVSMSANSALPKLPSLPISSSAEARGCFEETEKLAPDEEEAAFLRSLGWEENAGEEALTREEIESFLSEYKKRRPASK